ncbi:hypothetical protein [Endozoicomonas sp.]|uniref:hypothetical protein n=1 Tax=Endozoicomonas sp. TaxID=1892382 RepID=UPI002885DD54|nr:hypothetical protein [Endozoicomonas sp.]
MGKSILCEISLECDQGSYQLVSEQTNPVMDGASVELSIEPHHLVLFDAEGQLVSG